jgi:hypothetical protein
MQFFAQFCVGSWQRSQAVSNRLNVETATAGNDGHISAVMDFIYRPKRCHAKFFGIHFRRCRDDPDQMMRCFREQARARFCRQHIQAAIDLECVRAHNFAVAFFGHVCSQLRFSGRGRPDDKENTLHQSAIDRRGDVSDNRWKRNATLIARRHS